MKKGELYYEVTLHTKDAEKQMNGVTKAAEKSAEALTKLGKAIAAFKPLEIEVEVIPRHKKKWWEFWKR